MVMELLNLNAAVIVRIWAGSLGCSSVTQSQELSSGVKHGVVFLSHTESQKLLCKHI